MVARYIGDAQWTALDADAKPTNAAVADTLTTLDTRRIFIHQGGGTWIEIGTGTGGGGGGGGGFAAGGSINKSGDGTSIVISIAHGLNPAPDLFYALPLNAAARGIISYGIDGTNINLTYPIAPASGSNNLSYVWGAGYVNAAGAGSTPTQPVKYLVYKSGTTFYAKNGNTGAIDSSNASPATVIQYALDNLTAGRSWKETVKLRGDFTFPTITVPSFTVLDLTEARLLQTAATNNNFIRNADTTNGNTNIEIFGGLIDGNRANQSSGGTEDGQSMLEFMKCSNIWIHNTKLQYGDFHNIRFKECTTDIKVTEITSIEARHEHISDHAQLSAVGVCRGHFIANNYFENIVDGNTSIATVNISDCYIIGNYTYKTFGPTSGIAANGLRQVIVGNTVIDCSGVGIYLAQLNDVDFDSSNSIVANNVVINAASYGISVSGYPCTGIVFANNRVHLGGATQAAGIYCSLSQNCIVSNNVVSNRGGNGIYVLGTTAIPAKRIKVIGNVCYNNGQGVGGGGHQGGIAVVSFNASGDVSYVTVENNQCFDNQGTKTQLYGVRISNATNCVTRFNDLRDNGTAGYNAAGTNTGSIEGGNLGVITANADTSSGVVATVETEVNELKAVLRAAGLIG